jgi:hypothetical protein
MKKLIYLLLISTSILFSGEFYDQGDVKGITVEVISDETLIEGNNDLIIKLSKNKKAIKNAVVKAKFFMPEMPGMPYMEYIGKAKLDGNEYKTKINFSMSGTWQYHILFKINGKKYRFKGSVNLGQSNGGGMKCGPGKCGAGMM